MSVVKYLYSNDWLMLDNGTIDFDSMFKGINIIASLHNLLVYFHLFICNLSVALKFKVIFSQYRGAKFKKISAQ